MVLEAFTGFNEYHSFIFGGKDFVVVPVYDTHLKPSQEESLQILRDFL